MTQERNVHNIEVDTLRQQVQELERYVKNINNRIMHFSNSEERLETTENEIKVLKNHLLAYICQTSQKDPNPQWTNERLNVLEMQVKILKQEALNYWDKLSVDGMAQRVKDLEERDTATRIMIVDLLKEFVEFKDKYNADR